jgi:hypothetical protein
MARIVAGLAAIAILAFIAFVILFITHYGDPPSGPGLVIKNETQTTLWIYDVIGPGKETLARKVAPGTAKETGIECAAGTLVARSPHGDFVARRGPFPTCNESDWVISETPTPVPQAAGGT